MNDLRTLHEAGEQLEIANTRAAAIENQIADLKASGVIQEIEKDGVIHFESPVLAEVITLKGTIQALEIEKAGLIQSAKDLSESAVVQSARITELEKSAKTVETRAREMLASQGGPPLAVDGQDSLELTPELLRTQLNAEKDPQARFAIYSKLKNQEAKATKVNGTR